MKKDETFETVISFRIPFNIDKKLVIETYITCTLHTHNRMVTSFPMEKGTLNEKLSHFFLNFQLTFTNEAVVLLFVVFVVVFNARYCTR